MIQTPDYPLLQAYVTQDRIRDLLEIGYHMESNGKFEHAKEAFLKARELVCNRAGNRAVYRMIDAEVKRLRIPAARAERDRMI